MTEPVAVVVPTVNRRCLHVIFVRLLGIPRAADRFLVVVAWALISPQVLLGAHPGQRQVLPGSPALVAHGVRVTVDASWVNSPGYRPVSVTIRNWPPGPARQDRQFLVELRPNWNSYFRQESCTAQYVDLPEGHATKTVSISVPQHQSWQQLAVDIWEDGQKLEEVSGEFGLDTNSRHSPFEEASDVSPGVLVIDRDAPTQAGRAASTGTPLLQSSAGWLPDLSGLRVLFHTRYGNGMPNGLRLPGAVDSIPIMELLPPGELPASWRDLTCFDLVFVSLDDLKWTADNHPQTFQSLLDWTLAGGNLCVFGVGDELQRLVELEQLLGCESTGELANPANKPPAGWTAPNSETYTNTVQDKAWAKWITASEEGTYGYPQVNDDTASNPTAVGTKQTSPPVPSGLFVVRNLGLGQLAAIDPADEFLSQEDMVGWLLTTLSPTRWIWYQRHGLSVRRENRDYWNFLIPGVGMAPVVAFNVLITAFVIVIGPVNFFLLRRWRRLNWLLVTVPLGAALVTGSLFIYALSHDGLGVRARIRSFTEIDQRRKNAVVWSRQSYYAGLAPSRGLSFPSQAAVIPIDQFPESIYGYGYRRDTRQRRLVWDEGQRLERGYLASRDTLQLLVIQSQTSSAGLEVKELPNAPPTIVNRLGMHIKSVLVCDSKQNYYLGENIPPDATFPPQPLAPAQACEALKPFYLAHRLGYPAGFDERTFQSIAAMNRGYAYYWGGNSNYPTATSSTSLLEQRLMQLINLDRDPLSARSYLAVVDRPSVVATGIREIREEAGFHVVRGRW